MIDAVFPTSADYRGGGCVYRHFGVDDELLYVGISKKPRARHFAHKGNINRAAASWRDRVLRITAKWYGTYSEALAAEAAAIYQEAPECNILKSPSPRLHGRYRRPPGYASWCAMILRCHSPNSKNYPGWGGRGIQVCDRWRYGENGKSGFECFIEDVGPPPGPGYSIGRLDNDGNYERGAVRWETHKQQVRNVRSNHVISYRGQQVCLSEAVEIAGSVVGRSLALFRLQLGWSIEEAVETPPKKRRYKGRAILDLSGKRFGYLTVIAEAGTNKWQNMRWRCLCDCGNEIIASGGSLTGGRVASCGCFRDRVRGRSSITHGATQRGDTPEYSAWSKMKSANHRINVEWAKSFERFLDEVGPRPSSKHILARIDITGNYEPGNVAWMLRHKQIVTRSLLVDYNGKQITLLQAVSAAGNVVPYQVAWKRIKRGWAAERAVSTPLKEPGLPMQVI